MNIFSKHIDLFIISLALTCKAVAFYNGEKKRLSIKTSLLYLIAALLLLLFGLIGASLRSSYEAYEHFFEANLITKAQSIFDLVVDLRHWNAEFGGVYVKSDKLKPNPYLEPSSIKSDANETLVWINPAFMTRQISDIASQREGFALKITSDKLINQHNAPTPQEGALLRRFVANPDVPYYYEIKEGRFSFMGALKTEESCLQCHRKQGYKVGDVRGGISVSFDIQKERESLEMLRDQMQRNILYLTIAAAALLGALGLYGRIRASDEAQISTLNATLAYQVRELDAFNATLHQRVREEVHKQRAQEHLLIQQSKLAALGEMIGNIAHQWRQPIAAVSAILLNIKYSALAQGVEKGFIDARMGEAEAQLRYMSQTIEDFRSFFKPDQECEAFDVAQECHKAYKIIQAVLNEHQINLQRFSKPGLIAWGYPSAFAQAVLNILSNAKDVLIERRVAAPRIEIHIEREGEWIVCTISDNGGGIEAAVLERIFEPYFTTKARSGTGIGLYIAQEIIHKHMHGSLSAYNTAQGAAFKIMIPQGAKDV